MEMHGTIFGLNSIDFLMAFVVAAIVWIRRGDGLVVELVKLLGVVCSVFMALHYYTRFAHFLRVQFFGKEAAADLLAFILLSIPTLLIFFVISRGWDSILGIKTFKLLDCFGNIVLSFVRGYLICGLILLGLILSQHKYATPWAQQSISRLIFPEACVHLYRASYEGFVEKFFPGEPINRTIFTLMEIKVENVKSNGS